MDNSLSAQICKAQANRFQVAYHRFPPFFWTMDPDYQVDRGHDLALDSFDLNTLRTLG